MVKKYPFRFYTLCLSYTSNRCDKVMSKIFRIIKTHTPDYRLNVAWRNEKLARFYSHRLKLSTPPFEKIGITYKFTCKCATSYLGESRRQLISRIQEHNRPSSNSAISDHIYGNTVKKINPCLHYKTELTALYGDKPSPQNKISFIQDCFTLIQTNLSSYHFRKEFEAIAITVMKPILNAQIAHRNVTIIWYMRTGLY